jgi:hypothetical protein
MPETNQTRETTPQNTPHDKRKPAWLAVLTSHEFWHGFRLALLAAKEILWHE